MKFSVLMSVYHKDDANHLLQALKSVWENQTVKPAEIVLVKDGKLTVELDKVICQYSKKAPLKVVSISQNVGLGSALKIGLNNCSHNIVARMDSDDISSNDRFEHQMDCLKNKPQLDLVGGNIVEFNNSPEQIIGVRKVPEKNEDIYHMIKMRNPINHVTVMFRKNRIIEAGNYQKMIFFEDYYLWARMIKLGMKFYNIQKNLVYVRAGNEMLKRRHGIKYIKKELNHFWALYKIGVLTKLELIKVLVLRIPTRFIPSSILSFIYKTYLRN